MKIRTFTRHIREGGRNVVRNGWMSFASASSIAISLFILGVFLVLALNVDYISKQIENQVQIQVFLDVNIAKSELQNLQNQIGMLPDVSKVTYVSKEQGLEMLKQRLGKDGQELLNEFGGDNNPLPDAFKVEVRDPALVGKVAAQIQQLNNGMDPPPITKVNYGKDTVDTLFKVMSTIRNIGLILVVGLAFTSLFLISNTIKLTIVARRQEISIMKLVGATNGFIRWPFFIEGAVLGLIGSLIPVAVMLYGYRELVDYSRYNLGLLMIKLLPFGEIFNRVGILLVVIGLIIGIWGSTISVRRFLKV